MKFPRRQTPLPSIYGHANKLVRTYDSCVRSLDRLREFDEAFTATGGIKPMYKRNLQKMVTGWKATTVHRAGAAFLGEVYADPNTVQGGHFGNEGAHEVESQEKLRYFLGHIVLEVPAPPEIGTPAPTVETQSQKWDTIDYARTLDTIGQQWLSGNQPLGPPPEV